MASVVAVAGRRIDAADAEASRFPLAAVARVRDRIRELLIARRAAMVVSSAACGTDLLALEIAGDLGLRRSIVLPAEPAAFRASSVVDRPGDWGASYDGIIAEVAAAGDLLVREPGCAGDAAYAATNRAILELATGFAAAAGLDRLAVIVWNGEPRGPGDITLNFADAARGRGFAVVEISTL
ncbi:MAG TPA: hypothetical protein PLL30_15890 [Candidatus Krumholzibacteria bacterium]|nr:hypothetical protein [Candidatus Krumholzibacteria bacterium]HPD73252.1 hypothetical protein [Candidatus Krumholzibacteria bacterium]HRY40214.1 hypothetical protein [Candidatus Krumholzibacteria bacterium]